MICPRCNGTVPDNSIVCPSCGEVVRISHENEWKSLYSEQGINGYYSPSVSDGAMAPPEDIVKVKKGSSWIIISLAAVALIVLAVVVSRFSQMNKLKQDITGTWYHSEDTIIKVLDIRENTFTYSVTSAFFDYTVDYGTWKVEAPDKISMTSNEGYTRTFTVEFSSRGSLILTPSFSDSESYEIWVSL